METRDEIKCEMLIDHIGTHDLYDSRDLGDLLEEYIYNMLLSIIYTASEYDIYDDIGNDESDEYASENNEG